MSAKSTIGRKAATSVVKHSVHGTVSKAKRQPARASRLLGLGALAGGAAGFLAGRRSAPAVAPVVHPVPAPKPAAGGKPAAKKPKPKTPPDTAAAASAVQAAAGRKGDAPLPPPE